MCEPRDPPAGSIPPHCWGGLVTSVSLHPPPQLESAHGRIRPIEGGFTWIMARACRCFPFRAAARGGNAGHARWRSGRPTGVPDVSLTSVDDDVVVMNGARVQGVRRCAPPSRQRTGGALDQLPCKYPRCRPTCRPSRERGKSLFNAPNRRTDRPSGIGRSHVHPRAARRCGQCDCLQPAFCLSARQAVARTTDEQQKEQRLDKNRHNGRTTNLNLL